MTHNKHTQFARRIYNWICR